MCERVCVPVCWVHEKKMYKVPNCEYTGVACSPILRFMFSLCPPILPPSQFGAEFRRFSLDRSKPGRFDEFYGLLQHVHRIPNVDLLVGYADIHGDLLPINNDDNYHKAISTASPLLRLFLQRKGKNARKIGNKFHLFILDPVSC